METTRPSLLLRIRDRSDEIAWETFHRIYRPVLFRFAHARGLGHDDAEDIVQHALAKVHEHIDSFEYDPGRGRFQGWLRTIVNNRVRNLLRAREVADRHHHALLETESEAADTLTPEEVFDQLWIQEHLWHCLRELELETDEKTLGIYTRLVFDEAPVETICREFGVERGNVYTIRWRLTKRIAEKMRFLTEDEGASGNGG